MRAPDRRLLFATLFALAAAALIGIANPAPRFKADVRADAEGFVLSLEYSARLVG